MYHLIRGKGKRYNSIYFYTMIMLCCVCLFVFGSFTGTKQKEFRSSNNKLSSLKDTTKRKALLAEIVGLLPADETKNGRVSFLDKTFGDWLNRTGELPPDFDQMPSIPFLPDPLIIDEGGKNIPVKTKQQWAEKREWLKKELQYYITGTFPPAPNNLQVKILSEKKDGKVTLRMVELSFGPGLEARLRLELMIPEGKGPFPVFLSQWYHRGWAQVAVRRGYIGCVYTGADNDDDTENYSEVWAGKYDFTRLMRRAYGASRAIDYLYTLPVVDKPKIALTGHSRNGKLSLMAAAFDERITAVIPSSGGSGAEVPWRYASHEYDVEDIALLTCAQPSWLHPRLRFFIGRENKLPIDQNSFMALIAPRGLMLSSATNEEASNPWGIEQAYLSAKKVYKFLGVENNLAIRLRNGLHGTRASDIEEYLDFFDYIFKRSKNKPENKLFYNYSFDNWRINSGETINPLNYARKGILDIETGTSGQKIESINTWEEKKVHLQKKIRGILGEEPPGVINEGPVELKNGGAGEAYFGTYLRRPAATKTMGRMAITPYKEFGDYLYGYLYYPLEKEAEINKGQTKLPVVVYLHEYDYSKGFSSQQYDHAIQPFFEDLVSKGFVVFSYDMVGFGNRIEEGSLFYQHYPRWSIMGKCVADLQGALDAITNLNFVDSSKISVVGYSLGAMAGLYTAALDKRIASIVSVCGFTPMRLDIPQKETEGIKAYSHLKGILPRLGFFAGYEERIPFDFHEILASIAPRPLFVIAPAMDKNATLSDVQKCVMESKKIYQLYGSPGNIEIYSPHDYNRFSKEMQDEAVKWILSRSSGN